MKRRCFCFVAAFAFMAVFAVGAAEAANGTLNVIFKHKDENGTEQALQYAYVYLRDAAAAPPMEAYFSPADYILGPSDGNGLITASVPEGEYFIRITRRYPKETIVSRPLGPPEPGDYSWTPIVPITINPNQTTDLGTQYTDIFGTPPIIIKGYVRDFYTGVGIAGRYVRAQTEKCIQADYSSWDEADWVDTNRCGPVKHFATSRTDANGMYTILIREAGTYYIVESKRLGDHHQQYAGNRWSTGWTIGPVTVEKGEQITMNDMVVPPAY